MLLEAIAADAPSDQDAPTLAPDRDLSLAEPDRVLFPALIRGAPGLLERRAGHTATEPTLFSQIAGLLGEAKGPAPPSAELYLSAKTVKTHLRHPYQKLGTHSGREAVQHVRARGPLAASSGRP